MSEPEFSAFIFEAHDPDKFHKYIEIPHINGFSLPTDPNGKVYLLDKQNGWSDHNGCYYNENGNPDGWIVLSNDGSSFLKFNMQKVVTSKGENIFYSSNHYKVNLKKQASNNDENKVKENNKQQNQQSQIKKPNNQSKKQEIKQSQNKQDGQAKEAKQETKESQKKQERQEKEKIQEKQEQQKSQVQKKNKKQPVQFYDDQQEQTYQYKYDYSKNSQFVEKVEAQKQQESQQQQNKQQIEEETEQIEKQPSQVDENQKKEKRERKPGNQDNKKEKFRRDKRNKNRNDDDNENQENQNEKENRKHYNLSVKENQLSKDDFLKHLQDVYEIKTKNVILFENEILQLIEEKDAVKIYLQNRNERKDQKQKFIISI